MVDLSVKIGSVELENPIMPASGAFSTDLAQVMDINRLGALVAKTVSREYRIGNPPPRVAELECGMINSIGLPTKGIGYFLGHQVPGLCALHAAAGGLDLRDDRGRFRGDDARSLGPSRRRCDRGQHLVSDAQSRRRQFRAARGSHLQRDQAAFARRPTSRSG